MRLKQIQMQGFKSFVERTVMNYNDNITCVVGPNGCGKSNVVDAVRWAMGEMSVKSLRGGNMEDVIFHGSDDMAEVGMAEVTLVFDNNEGLAPPEYSGFSEIQVTRRLFRTGDSEYYINRTPCRLKDITDLFLGSGAGTKAYSIIEQGKIEQIITMKPEQRRVLIEEAAGVSKYRVRKLEATRKMDATRNNLLRIRDIIAELQRQMNSLNRQAKKAERYKQYRGELKELELELAAVKAIRIQTDKSQVEDKIKSASQVEDSLKASLENAESEAEKKKAELIELERELTGWRNKVVESGRNVEKGEQSLVMLRHKKESAERDQVRLAEERKELAEREESLAAETAEITSELQELERAVSEAQRELAASEESCREKDQEYSELVEAADTLEKHLASINSGVEKLSERIEWASRRQEEIQDRKKKIEERKAGLEDAMEELARSNITSNEKIYKLKKELSEIGELKNAAQAELDKAKTDRAVSADRLSTLTDKLTRANSRLESLKEMERNFEGYQTGVKTIMERRKALEAQGQNGTYSLVADLITTNPEYELALEAVLGDKLQTIVVKTMGHGLDNIRYLKQEGGGRSNFVPIEGVSGRSCSVPDGLREMGAEPLALKVSVSDKFAEPVSALIGDALVVDDIEKAATVMRESEATCTLVTRDGVLLDKTGVLAGGSEDSFSGLLAKKREIEELTTRVEVLSSEVENAKAAVAELDEKIKVSAGRVEELKERSYRLEIEKNNQEKDLRQGTDSYNAMKTELTDLEQESDNISQSIRDLENEVEEGKAKIEKDHAAAERVKQDLEERRRIISSISSERSALTEKRTASQVRAAGLSEKIEGRKAQLERLAKAREEVAAGIEKRGVELSRISEELKKLSDEMVEAGKWRDQAVVEAKKLEERSDKELQRFEAEKDRLTEHENGIKKMYRELEDKKSERMDTELSLSQLKVQWESLSENVRDKFNREIEEVVDELKEQVSGEYPEEEKRQRREELRNKLDRMGDVNLTAIDEFNEISERHGFLSSQESDLIQALDNLEVTIAKINNAYKKSFKKTFEEVNLKFQEVMPRLFHGGKGELALTNPEDLLESGVEVMVQLPGKKATSIALLSGGEKALTATALIISLFLVKPSPFCILDEVDAALDEVNVLRFNDIVRELAKNSQLIIITHNKRTMELAQTMYGVTMEKKGVSKIVSVRLVQSGEGNAA